MQFDYQTFDRMAEENSNNTEVFVYTEGVVVPEDVVRVRVHPSVTVIPEQSFHEHQKLEEVELSDGLLEIGKQAFCRCNSLKRINIPSTVTRICSYAFHSCALEEVKLCDGLVEIGNSAFYGCKSLEQITIPSTVTLIGECAFAHMPLVNIRLPDSLESLDEYAVAGCTFPILRIPPLITTISKGLVGSCIGLMSIELSESVTLIDHTSLSCRSLRNVAIPHNDDVFIRRRNNENYGPFCICSDLQQLFDSEETIINSLKHRFDNLPVHKMIYYQSYNNVTVEKLNNATGIRISQRRSKVNPSGKQQDCLGMTPLHILACSTVQNIELYKVLVKKYPETLITEDRWGAIPLLYAVWGNAPDEIVNFFVESYKSIHPNNELNWTDMIVTLGRAYVPKEVIRALLDLYIEFVPDLNWEEWINELAVHNHILEETFGFLVQCGFTDRVNAIGLKQFREEMTEAMKKDVPYRRKEAWLNIVRSKLVNYEEEYRTLKEATTLLELAMWKKELEESDSKKKRKRTEKSDSDFREQYRISCGADIVIEHVLPFLVPSASSCESESDSEGSSSSSSDDELPSASDSDGNESE